MYVDEGGGDRRKNRGGGWAGRSSGKKLWGSLRGTASRVSNLTGLPLFLPVLL